jgi:two-component system cell cycle response regulator
MKSLNTRQVVIRIAIIISVVEFSFMLFLEHALSMLNLDGSVIAVINATVLVAISAPLIYILVIKPFIFDRDEALAQVSQLAYVDPLTQLANRRLLSMHLEKAVAGIVRHKMYGALLLLDLDGFKHVNDAHGHDAGDAVLIEIARRLQSFTRTEDVVARLGGDEFVVLIDHLDIDEPIARDQALRIAEKLIDMAKKPVDFNGKTLQVGASVGVRLLSFEKLDTETAIGDADLAMYRAKQAGKGCVVLFEK